MINPLYKNNIASVMVVDEASSWFGIELNQHLIFVAFYPIYMDYLMDFSLKNTAKPMEEHRIKWGSKKLIGLDFENSYEALRVECARICLEINDKKIKLLIQGINNGQNIMCLSFT